MPPVAQRMPRYGECNARPSDCPRRCHPRSAGRRRCARCRSRVAPADCQCRIVPEARTDRWAVAANGRPVRPRPTAPAPALAIGRLSARSCQAARRLEVRIEGRRRHCDGDRRRHDAVGHQPPAQRSTRWPSAEASLPRRWPEAAALTLADGRALRWRPTRVARPTCNFCRKRDSMPARTDRSCRSAANSMILPR